MYKKTFTYDAPAEHDAEVCINKFEADAAEYIIGLTVTDIGGIVVYKNANGDEVAMFDYELLTGHVY
jgi:hypothetical protein